jgi:hypothetical protein
VISFTPRQPYPWYLLVRRLDGPQSRSGRGGEEKSIYSLLLLGIDPVRLAHSLVTVVTELSQLIYILHYGELRDLYSSLTIRKEFEMGVSCSAHGREGRFLTSSGWKN